ncbi:MAG: MBL fold metallo-hydrolase [Candidatus Riflebacteria bacterium]|nr:MBL fold metallo-hydrolase [Candidatus Riflebacteria bacterium]
MVLADLVDFVEFDEKGVARLPGGVSIAIESTGIAILEDGRLQGRIRGDPCAPTRRRPANCQLRPFYAPLLGVSVIGSGHGFDPGNRTSGFIVWVQGQGVMVDPPVDSVDWLQDYDLSSKQVSSLILTHCHADHDAGTLQKILQEGRVTIYTTPTVMASFVRKYSALTQMAPQAFRGLFDFIPVRTGEPVSLHGAEATFRYSLHSLPCAGFEIKLEDKSLVYPSDTLNDPERIRKLHEEGVLSSQRRDELLAFPWHHTLVIHEAGIPPIHTPIEYLSTLATEVKKRTLLVHVSEKTIPSGSGLKIAPTGLENTVDLGVPHLPVQEAVEILDAMSRV